jgi:hypothetical protein
MDRPVALRRARALGIPKGLRGEGERQSLRKAV